MPALQVASIFNESKSVLSLFVAILQKEQKLVWQES
jgi:hypothetical protein